MPVAPTPQPIRCDSCGQPASAAHIQDRLARLQRSTRWRPIHISLLLICTAPPEHPEDDLYATDLAAPSPGSQAYVTGLFRHLGIATSPATTREQQLAELQHAGTYVARLVECPLPPGSTLEALAARHAPDLLKRIEFSYKPKRIALLDPVAPGLADLLLSSKFASLIENNGKGIDIP